MTTPRLNADDRSRLVYTMVQGDQVVLTVQGTAVLTPSQSLTHGIDLISHAGAALTGQPADRKLEEMLRNAFTRAVMEWAEEGLDPDLRTRRRL